MAALGGRTLDGVKGGEHGNALCGKRLAKTDSEDGGGRQPYDQDEGDYEDGR
jgi:hypothetical protein